jgi:small GTP-binding protein
VLEASLLKYNYIFKLLLLGEPAVGKTSLIIRYVKDTFKSDYLTTLGANFLVKHVTLPNDSTVLLQIWDIAGHARFARYAHAYYAGASGVLYVYDVTRSETLERLKEWHNDVQERAPKKILSVIIGNKNDLEAAVPDSEREKMSQELSALNSFSTSAKDGTGVNEAFHAFAELLAHQAISKSE